MLPVLINPFGTNLVTVVLSYHDKAIAKLKPSNKCVSLQTLDITQWKMGGDSYFAVQDRPKFRM